MKITFEEEDASIIYRVSDFDARYMAVLDATYYQHDSRGYFKRYPKDTPYLDRMMRHFAASAETMFDQLGYFSEAPWQQGLQRFCTAMEGSDVAWWLTGSCSACVRGIDFAPHDVDIMIDADAVPFMTERFRDYLIEPILDTGGWVTRDFGVMFMDVRIDIASDPSPILDQPDPVDCGPYACAHLETVLWQGFRLRVPPLELLLNVNRRRGRQDRVAKIEAHLAAASA